ncbi:MAG: YicC family protein [Candidatus Bipolaricaulaceae bacterium]
MTGFGRGQAQAHGFQVEADLRTLNSRFLEIRVRGLSEFPFLVHLAEGKLRSAFSRGTVEVNFRVLPLPEVGEKKVDLDLAKRYLAELRALRCALGVEEKPGLSHLLALGVFQEVRPKEELLWPAVEEALEKAISAAQAERAREGKALKEALLREKEGLFALLRRAEALAAEDQRIAAERLKARAKELAVLDPGRLNAEVALLLGRIDVREELDRLWAHVRGVEELLSQDGSVGKALEFLAQEIGREAGTLAAKAYGPDLASVALEIRLSAERLREQARNVE